MIPAGKPVDQQLSALDQRLGSNDLVIDAGNSHYLDTLQRSQVWTANQRHFLGVGVSGGEHGARHGVALMIGGSKPGYDRIAHIFDAIAAKVDNQPCCGYLGAEAAGHFVKMMHNGIEYADMQLIAEIYSVLRKLNLSYPDMQALFSQWNEGELNSFLIEITIDILGSNDPETGLPLVEMIMDRAGQKGTGQWARASSAKPRFCRANDQRSGVCEVAIGDQRRTYRRRTTDRHKNDQPHR